MSFATVGLQHFLVLSAILFVLGLVCVVSRRNAIGVLMGVELILNAANINLCAFSHYVTGAVGGQVFTIFVILLAAAEAAVALAVVLAIFQHQGNIAVEEATTLKG
jgi:NADH-quinone oxidoreductase subunit K